MSEIRHSLNSQIQFPLYRDILHVVAVVVVVVFFSHGLFWY